MITSTRVDDIPIYHFETSLEVYDPASAQVIDQILDMMSAYCSAARGFVSTS